MKLLRGNSSFVALFAAALLSFAPPALCADLKCGDHGPQTPVPAGTLCTTASVHTDAGFALAKTFLQENFLGLGVPKCDTSNCGAHQTCRGGSQVTAGSITYAWASATSNDVCATIAKGTTTQQHCTECAAP